MREILDRLAALERKVNGMFRVGLVSDVDREKGRVRVTFARDDVSAWLPVLVHWAKEDRDYKMPAIDEQVTCVFLPSGIEDGFVLGSFYSDEDAIPDGADADGMRVVEFDDGARFEYSTEDSTLRILIGELELEFTPEHIRFGGASGTQPYMRGTDATAFLGAVIDLIAAHIHPTGVGPSGPPATAAGFTAKKADLPDLLSEIITGR